MKRIQQAQTWIFYILVGIVLFLLISLKAGYSFMSVQSDSMVPVFQKHDVIVVRREERKDYAIGDIVTFSMDTGLYNTHRIVDKQTKNGCLYYTTKGDNVSLCDGNPITNQDIYATYTGIRLAAIGGIIDFFKTPKMFFFFILIPVFIMFIISLYDALKLWNM